jgi:hypothetical protein
LVATHIMAENGDVFIPRAKGKRREQFLWLKIVMATDQSSALPTLPGTPSEVMGRGLRECLPIGWEQVQESRTVWS